MKILKDQVLGNYFIKVKNQTFEQITRLHLNTKKFSVYIQTDKAIYKPGEKVQFRVLVLNADTKPFPTTSVDIFITDGSNNRIKQYENIFFRRGVYRQSLQLSDEPVLGNWMIHVKVDGKDPETIKVFEVAKYVLPKFEVTVVTKSKIYYDHDIIVSYSAKYTYGKDVEGSAVVSAEGLFFWWGRPIRRVEKSLDNSTKTTSINIQNDLNLESIYWMQPVRLTVTFTEALTGIQRNATSIVNVYKYLYNLQLINSDNNIKANLPFTVKAFVKDIYEAPITDDKEPVTFEVTYTYEYPPETTTSASSDGRETTIPTEWWITWRPPPMEIVTYIRFLKNGMTELPIIVSSNVTSISVRANYKESYSYSYAPVMPTTNKQYIEIKVPETLPMDRSTSMEIISNVKINLINYLIFARNKIVAKGQVKGSNKKSIKFNFQPTYSMTPTAKMIVFYVTSDGEIVSASKVLSFESLLPNFVNIDLSKSEARPSSLLNISVKSKPLSYVGLLGVDQSVLLLKSGNDIDQEMVNNELRSYTYLDQYNEDWNEPVTYNYYSDFANLDIFILTNANPQYAPTTSTIIPEPVQTANIPEIGSSTSSNNEIVTRKHFPETWLFDCVDNVRGFKNITRKVPDTITSWVITGFSMNFQNGFGLTKEPTKLTVFMPFFIYLNLPYSIKRGEIISIQAVIFNYMNADASATVTMFNENQEFEFVEKTQNQKMLAKKITTKSNSGTSVKFIIRALKVGYITLKMEALTSNAGDRIEQKLLVLPEGITRYINTAILVDLRSQNKFNKKVDIVVPKDIVPDSLRIEASLIGDILGPTLDNLDKLIQMPYGCGEQNMLFFVPDIIVLDYLTSANRLTSD
ncbi:CD109 antigen-like [Chironomus tepperi]|uniref:CD109 antigen-like n=1 Tax=Chironomus tepperi TaxID=113505 RepID=UPI00391F7C49